MNVLLGAVNHFFEPRSFPLSILVFLPVAYVTYWKKSVTMGAIAHVLANLVTVSPMVAWLA